MYRTGISSVRLDILKKRQVRIESIYFSLCFLLFGSHLLTDIHVVSAACTEQWPLPPAAADTSPCTHHFTVRIFAESRSELNGPHEHEE